MTEASNEDRLNLTEIILDHVFSVRFEDFDARTIERAKYRLLDAFGNILAGYKAVGTESILELVSGWGGKTESTLIGDGRKVPAHNAAMINSMLMRSFDFEPVGAEGPGQKQVAAHITGTTVPVALAVGEREKSAAKDILTALLIGEDVASRLAFGSGFDVYSGQDNTGTVNGVGAAIIAALLMGLDREGVRAAMGIVINQLAGTITNIEDKKDAFKFPMAFASRNAITAAELAAVGVKGPNDPISGRHAFLDTYCADPNPAVMIENLGQEFYADAVIKPWSCCRAVHPSVDACTRIAKLGAYSVEDIQKVIVQVPARTANGFVGQEFNPGECFEVSASFSLRYTCAVSLVHGTVRPELLNLDTLAEPKVQAVLAAIEIDGTLKPESGSAAEITVILNNGDRITEKTVIPQGDIYHNPLSARAIEDKFRSNSDFSERMTTKQTLQLQELLLNFEEQKDLEGILFTISSQ